MILQNIFIATDQHLHFYYKELSYIVSPLLGVGPMITARVAKLASVRIILWPSASKPTALQMMTELSNDCQLSQLPEKN